MSATAPSPTPRLVIGRGARATEEILLAEVSALAAASREDPRLLARPLRIVVPSRSLREHVAARVVAHLGRAVAGVTVQTLHGVAMEILERAGDGPPLGDAVFPIAVRELARAEPALRSALGGFEDGYGTVLASVADLLDAGFEGGLHTEAIDDWLSFQTLSSTTRARVRAVARVAEGVGRELARLGCAPSADRLRRARELLELEPEAALPTRSLLVHGFADATGVASDLLVALVRHMRATVLLDHPADPAQPDRDDVGVGFTRRLRSRFEGLAAVERSSSPPETAALRGIAAVGSASEVRAVAERIRALLDDAAARPEAIGVVARSLEPFAIAIRTHFRRLGIPFSASGALGPPAGPGRRLHALLDLVADGGGVHADRWLDAERSLPRARRYELRLAFHASGAGRVGDVAQLDADALLGGKPYLALPTRRGLQRSGEGEEGGGSRAPRRALDGEVLRHAIGSARRLATQVGEWPERAPLAVHTARMRELAEGILGWRRDAAERIALEETLRGLEAEVPAGVALAREDLVLLVRPVLRDCAGGRFGGEGGGVQVLTATEARARTFDALFLLGANRDVFPRPIVEDPLLPDEVRRRLEELLPEIPIKRRAFEEEHYLFAQLLSAAPSITLSWQVANDDGKARTLSPLVERLRIARGPFVVTMAPSLQAPVVDAPRTAQEAALVEGLHGSRESFARLLELAAAEREELDTLPGARVDASLLARGRCNVLSELDPVRRSRSLGPYHGFVGPVALREDLRGSPLYVTQLERLVGCPWEFFLKRLLGLQPPPNALDALPELSPLLVGGVVHLVLQRIVEQVVPKPPEDLAGADFADARAVPWPEPADLDALLEGCAQEQLRAEGVRLPGFAALLVEAARPHLATARALGWPIPGADSRCLGSEVGGSVAWTPADGLRRVVHFRADRVDVLDGRLCLFDYKTGKAKDLAGRSLAERRARLLELVARGRYLQAAAYAFGSGGEGSFLLLQREPDANAVFGLDSSDTEVRQAFESTAQVALTALERGTLVPRLCGPADPAAPIRCREWCEVHEGCLQGDAAARARLFEWTRRGEPASPDEKSLLDVWRLPEREVK